MMEDGELNGEPGEDQGKPREMRLLALLLDIVEAQGKLNAARLLGVNYRTLQGATESGVLTERMVVALERVQLSGGVAAARERERVDALVKRAGELAEGLREAMDRIDTVGGEVAALRAEVVAVREEQGEQAKAVQLLGRRVAALEAGRQGSEAASGSTAEGEQPGQARERPRYVRPRQYPQLVTKEAEEGEEQVYGEAAPVIAEWRRTYAEMTRLVKSGPSLRCNAVNERRLELEVALIQEHELTLPPARYPWSRHERQEQLWNRRQLQRTNRRERSQLQRRKWLRRLLTLGFWWE